MLTTEDLAELVAAFSVTHIGLSAVREPIINQLGMGADWLGLVDRNLTLPSFWLADSTGYEFWPDRAIAGRQIFRAVYTIIASALLFPALAAYPDVRNIAVDAFGQNALDAQQFWACFGLAATAQGIAIASLLNPSPLSLVPGFESSDDGSLQRDDKLKLTPRGLTRITRHPLILPVVPWGIANTFLTGRHGCDVAIFIGLALYAIAGCKAQDLRVEGSNQVGTVFEDGALTSFYRDTSFFPFAAIADGRQSFGEVLEELSYSNLACALVLGTLVEAATLKWIGIQAPF